MLDELDQGTLINSVSSCVGCSLGGTILGMLDGGDPTGGMDIGFIISQVAGIGGGVMLAIVGAVKNALPI